MEGTDLRELDQPIDGHCPLEPVGEAFVQVGPLALREPPVGGIADEDVPETERVVSATEVLATSRWMISRGG